MLREMAVDVCGRGRNGMPLSVSFWLIGELGVRRRDREWRKVRIRRRLGETLGMNWLCLRAFDLVRTMEIVLSVDGEY